MHEHKVVAKSKGKEIGTKVIQLPDTIAEAVKMVGSEAKVVELFNRQFTTDTRNSMAKPSTGGVELRTRVELYHNMVKNGVPAAQAKIIAGITDEDIEKVTTATEAKKAS